MVRGGEQSPRGECVHSDTGYENRGLHAAARIHEASCSVLCFSHVPEESHETAKRYPIERVFSIAYFPERERARRVPDAEFLHAYAEQFRGDEMPELMDDNEEYEYPDDKKYREHNGYSILSRIPRILLFHISSLALLIPSQSPAELSSKRGDIPRTLFLAVS